MAIKTNKSAVNVAYYITFTCHNWMPLIQQSDAYGAFTKWFEYLNSKNIKTLGYVIMPNHFHGILFLPENCKTTINKIVANGKRFIAYEIVNGLERNNHKETLEILFAGTTKSEKKRGKKHKVFIPSFDCKEIYNLKMLETKLAYIHKNPCSGKWNLADSYDEYQYSSVQYYDKGNMEYSFVTHFKELF